MIRRLLLHDGVVAACHFRDDGSLVEGYGLYGPAELAALAQLAHSYRRLLQGNVDQFSLFCPMRGWAPPRGWVARSERGLLCGVGGIACLCAGQTSVDELLHDMTEISHW